MPAAESDYNSPCQTAPANFPVCIALAASRIPSLAAVKAVTLPAPDWKAWKGLGAQNFSHDFVSHDDFSPSPVLPSDQERFRK